MEEVPRSAMPKADTYRGRSADLFHRIHKHISAFVLMIFFFDCINNIRNKYQYHNN